MTDEDLKPYGASRRPDGTIDFGPDFAAQMKSVPQGAATTIWCAVSPKLDGLGGVYCEDCDVAEVSPGGAGALERSGVDPWACDPDLAERLWALSESLTGVSY